MILSEILKAIFWSNLFTLESIDFAGAELVAFPVDFPERRRVLGNGRRQHRTRRNCRLVVCFVNTVNRCCMSWLECWHVRAGRWKDWLCWRHRWRTRWCCRTHFSLLISFSQSFSFFCGQPKLIWFSYSSWNFYKRKTFKIFVHRSGDRRKVQTFFAQPEVNSVYVWRNLSLRDR